MATELVADRQVFQQTLTQEVVEIALSDTDEVDLFSGTGANEVRALIFGIKLLLKHNLCCNKL